MQQFLDVFRHAGDDATRRAAMDAKLGRWVQENNHAFSEEEQQLLFRTSMRSLVPAVAAGLLAYRGFSRLPRVGRVRAEKGWPEPKCFFRRNDGLMNFSKLN